jgi:hypothetical protein
MLHSLLRDVRLPCISRARILGMYGYGLQGTTGRSLLVSPKATRFRKSNQSLDASSGGIRRWLVS